MAITLEENNVLRDGVQIGTFNADTCTVSTTEKQSPAIKGQIKAALVAAEVDVSDLAWAVADAEAPEDPNIPPCPLADHRGDKTPAVVDWWFTHHPEKAAAKYAGRKTHRTAVA